MNADAEILLELLRSELEQDILLSSTREQHIRASLRLARLDALTSALGQHTLEV